MGHGDGGWCRRLAGEERWTAHRPRASAGRARPRGDAGRVSGPAAVEWGHPTRGRQVPAVGAAFFCFCLSAGCLGLGAWQEYGSLDWPCLHRAHARPRRPIGSGARRHRRAPPSRTRLVPAAAGSAMLAREPGSLRVACRYAHGDEPGRRRAPRPRARDGSGTMQERRLTFDTLGLSADLLRTVADEGYTDPTPVQEAGHPPRPRRPRRPRRRPDRHRQDRRVRRCRSSSACGSTPTRRSRRRATPSAP